MRRIILAASLLLATPAAAGNTLVPAGQFVTVAKSPMRVSPSIEWNRLGARPGRNAESWTLDGDALNDLTFYGGLGDGQTLFREVNKRDRPLPRIASTMLVTDVPTLLENSYRIALDTPMFEVTGMEPAPFAGQPGLRFTYSFTRPNEDLPRSGEGRAAIVGGKLYLVTYEAPRIHFFAQSLAAFRAVADSAKM